jgi:hypothetical protein
MDLGVYVNKRRIYGKYLIKEIFWRFNTAIAELAVIVAGIEFRSHN